MMETLQQPVIQFLRLADVLKRTGLSRTSIYEMPTFPKPVKVPGLRCVVWVESEVLDFMQSALENRVTLKAHRRLQNEISIETQH